MPVFILTPHNLDSEKWRDTLHTGPCLIVTDNERGARGTVSSKFMPELGMRLQRPWTQEDLVSVAISNDHDPKEYDHGFVYVQRPNGEFVKFAGENKDVLIPIGARSKSAFSESAFDQGAFGEGFFGGAAPASDAVYGVVGTQEKDTAGSVTVVGGRAAVQAGSAELVAHGRIDNPPDVRQRLQNRRLITIHARGLLEFLDVILRPGSNRDIQGLWLDRDPKDPELIALLTDLRDELRQLNDRLANPKGEPAGLLKTVIAAFGKAGNLFLKTTAVVGGTETGKVIAAMVKGLLIATEVIDPDNAETPSAGDDEDNVDDDPTIEI